MATDSSPGTAPDRSPRSPLQPWIHAMRPRTLPLALASIILGALLALADDGFDPVIVLLAGLTAIFLQILSNLANDYGDFQHGADRTGRQGPLRVMESGQVTARAMQVALAITALLAMVTGLALVLLGAKPAHLPLFLLLGAGAVAAAFGYTMGARPYGYAGLGDIAVLIFFGWVGVLGTYYLQTQTLDAALALPATSCGLLAVGVLNVNNIRDIESDRKAGKQSVPVRLGRDGAQWYHALLLAGAALLALLYVLLTGPRLPAFLFVITLPLLWRHMRAVLTAQNAQALYHELKRLAQITLLFVITFGIGQVL